MDVVASLYGRNSLLEIVTRTAKDIFIPLTVGGGLRSTDDIKAILRAGADKVALNTAAIREPELVRSASRQFGSSTIVVSIEAIRQPNGVYEAYTDNGRERTGIDAVEWASEAAKLGAGEILLTSVDREGTGSGFELELLHQVAAVTDVPVIVCGGAGRVEHALAAAAAGADALALASILHYQLLDELKLAQLAFHEEGNVEYLRGGRSFGKVQPTALSKLKAYLVDNGVCCRFPV